MCLPDIQKPVDDLPVSDNEVDQGNEMNNDTDQSSDIESSSDSNLDSLNSWMNEHDYVEEQQSDIEFDPSEHSDDDVSLSNDSDDTDNMDNDVEDTSVDEDENQVPNDYDNIEDDDEEDDVVAAFIAASSERNRNHPPNLNVGSNVLIGGLSFHPCTNIIATGLSNGDISIGFVTSLCLIDNNTFATGDEDGLINVWDIRTNGCRFSFKKTEDSINSMISLDNQLVSASGDGILTVMDLLTKKMIIQSEPYKSALTSCVTMKRKTKIVCGTGEGSLITFNTGDYSMFNDEFPCVDKGAAVNKLLPVTENIVISALDNGKIRATHLFPNCHLGIVGHHQEMSVDLLDISDSGCLLASSCFFSNIIKFWNIEFFEEFDVKKHFKTVNNKDFNLPSSNAVNVTDFFSGLA
ncbi:WD repeat-containing protein 55 homolog isoform X2 [Daktulosphaira vitifoliae]|uniref:WD repeat-containing protein 55 homolog isoform X2 n=1 Tax=Daktulosphaira vitifoliae TaxID=58002 RepID=UPI0021AA31DD|nr:WD repeat-containing protein 55 homolog isoform X2 [Daktulosphaira vitifoliae]